MRHWVITGVSSGLGEALAQAALDRGDAVVGTMRTRDDAARFAALAPARAIAVVADLGDAGAPQRIVAEALAAFGRIDILVNNAGYSIAGAVEETSEADQRAIFATNFFAPLALIQAILPQMRAQGSGRIINIGSFASVQGLAGMGLYSATKFALAGLSEALAAELAPLGIRVTIVEPTGFRTQFGGRSMARATASIHAYQPLRDRLETGLARSNGHQPNDPHKGALALLGLADHPDPPIHLALGHDATDRITSVLETRLADYRAARELGCDTRVDAES
jgi:NAD(P)-dependent dehydrogenase (short-subunit alcohol dehydrogenase family)